MQTRLTLDNMVDSSPSILLDDLFLPLWIRSVIDRLLYSQLFLDPLQLLI